MKRLIVLALALAIAPAAFAQLYKYVDKDGKTVYSDTPPANTDSKQLNIQTGTTTAPAKTALERDKDLQKGRDDQAKKAAADAKQAAIKDVQCEGAKRNLAQYADGGRMQRMNDKGERVFMSDDEIDAARTKAQQEMDAACK
ncbi:MAG TPA: DUF4124 domain-containing protein [Usitatibacter sp.]|jgi:hypothetical protein